MPMFIIAFSGQLYISLFIRGIYMYWDKVLKEVLGKKNYSQKFNFTNMEVKEKEKTLPKGGLKLHKNKSYSLGPKYNGAYFTRREAQCMMLLIKGKTIGKTAIALSLSPRTIEFYLKNMKSKLGCRTKFELIELVLESSFLKNIDFV